MTSKIVVNNIEPDAGISTVTVNGDLDVTSDVTGSTGTFTGVVNAGTTATGNIFTVGDGAASGDRVIQFKRAARTNDINIQAINAGTGATNLLFNNEGGASIFGGGSVGIGTNTAGKTLDVRGTGGNFVAEISNTGTGANNNGVLFSTTNAASSTIIFVASSGGSERLRITGDGHTLPGVDNTSDLGSSSKRWRNIYSADLQLSNVGTGGNEVDGTEGKWTLQEAEDTVYMINRITGRRYKIKMEEV